MARVAAIYPAFATEINEMAMESAEGVQRLPILEILRVPGIVAGGQHIAESQHGLDVVGRQLLEILARTQVS
jgi:hypothetical protein